MIDKLQLNCGTVLAQVDEGYGQVSVNISEDDDNGSITGIETDSEEDVMELTQAQFLIETTSLHEIAKWFQTLADAYGVEEARK